MWKWANPPQLVHDTDRRQASYNFAQEVGVGMPGLKASVYEAWTTRDTVRNKMGICYIPGVSHKVTSTIG